MYRVEHYSPVFKTKLIVDQGFGTGLAVGTPAFIGRQIEVEVEMTEILNLGQLSPKVDIELLLGVNLNHKLANFDQG